MSGPTSIEDAVAGWRPEPVETTDTIGPWPVAAFAALLDQPAPADRLPPLWHWFSFLEAPPQSALGDDGHPAHGHFLPPVPDRRRMIAGGRVRVSRPLRIGARVVRRSRLAAVRPVLGRTGEMVFVTVRHRFECDGELALVEEQDVVYRSQPAGAPQARAPEPTPRTEPDPQAAWRLRFDPDERLLFRFSALTYNTHRIHYDQEYVTGVEGYPGLVVHGPLLALLLLELPRRFAPHRSVADFEYRLRQPSYAGRPVVADGFPDDDGARLTAGTPGAGTAITGRLRWAGADRPHS